MMVDEVKTDKGGGGAGGGGMVEGRGGEHTAACTG